MKNISTETKIGLFFAIVFFAILGLTIAIFINIANKPVRVETKYVDRETVRVEQVPYPSMNGCKIEPVDPNEVDVE